VGSAALFESVEGPVLSTEGQGRSWDEVEDTRSRRTRSAVPPLGLLDAASDIRDPGFRNVSTDFLLSVCQCVDREIDRGQLDIHDKHITHPNPVHDLLLHGLRAKRYWQPTNPVQPPPTPQTPT
jgi:hypothetical protein